MAVTLSTVLAASTPNDGSQTVTLPQIATTQGRVKVEAVGNIFFESRTRTSPSRPPIQRPPSTYQQHHGSPRQAHRYGGRRRHSYRCEWRPADRFRLGFALSGYHHAEHRQQHHFAQRNRRVLAHDHTTTRTYPITLTVTDSQGATTSGIVNLDVMPNPSPTLGNYPNIGVTQAAALARRRAPPLPTPNGNLPASPYLVSPTTLPGAARFPSIKTRVSSP